MHTILRRENNVLYIMYEWKKSQKHFSDFLLALFKTVFGVLRGLHSLPEVKDAKYFLYFSFDKALCANFTCYCSSVTRMEAKRASIYLRTKIEYLLNGNSFYNNYFETCVTKSLNELNCKTFLYIKKTLKWRNENVLALGALSHENT